MKAFDLHLPDVGVGPTPDEYESRYARARLHENSASSRRWAANQVIKHRAAYEQVQKETGVPWWWVGVIHMRESNFDFKTWLANGDSLNAPTWRVPAGLKGPGSPPWDWHTGAIISLRQMNYHKEKFDTLGKCLRLAEAYNGWGYITGAGRATVPANTSPYLWSGTTEYIRGKYVADGKFDPNTVDQQLGVICVIKQLEDLGLNLFPEKGEPVPSGISWIEFYRTEESNVVVGWNADKFASKLTTNSVSDLYDLLGKWKAGAGTFRVAPAGKLPPGDSPGPTPDPSPKPTPPKNVDPVIRLTKHPSGKRPDGLVQLIMEFYDNLGKKYGQILCVSGVPSTQFFRKGSDSIRGSLEPLPEGVWTVENIVWATGRDSYAGSHGTGLGPVWIGMEPLFTTQRDAIGMHRDDNAVGTAGCVGISSTEDLRELVRLLRLHDPKRCVVDYGLGSLPPAFRLPEPVGYPEVENISLWNARRVSQIPSEPDSYFDDLLPSSSEPEDEDTNIDYYSEGEIL